jgi:aryl carrier-like protein
MPGELYISGVGLTRGYLGAPRQTAQRFLANPHGPPGSRMYRTGDRARHTLSGELEYLGRRDQQVKLHGYRIELQDIESCLHDHAGVQDAAVVLHKQGTAEAQLVAYYVVAAGGGIPDVSALREHLRQRLPTYMMPSHFLELEQLPRTTSGDLDRMALPVPSRALQPKEYVAARTPTEQALVGIWEEIFKLERVSIHDNFFDLGGDSIVSIQIINRAERVGLNLSLRQTFEHPTIAELAPFVCAEVVARAYEAGEQTQA